MQQPNPRLLELSREANSLWTGTQTNVGLVKVHKHMRHVELQWQGQTLHLCLPADQNGYIGSLKAALDKLGAPRGQEVLTSLLAALQPAPQSSPRELQSATNEH